MIFIFSLILGKVLFLLSRFIFHQWFLFPSEQNKVFARVLQIASQAEQTLCFGRERQEVMVRNEPAYKIQFFI